MVCNHLPQAWKNQIHFTKQDLFSPLFLKVLQMYCSKKLLRQQKNTVLEIFLFQEDWRLVASCVKHLKRNHLEGGLNFIIHSPVFARTTLQWLPVWLPIALNQGFLMTFHLMLSLTFNDWTLFINSRKILIQN